MVTMTILFIVLPAATAHCGIDFEQFGNDLISKGRIEFHSAVGNFDERVSVKLTTFLFPHIKGTMLCFAKREF